MAPAVVFVTAENSARQPIRSASVTLKNGQATVRLTESGPGQYSASNLSPGSYTLEASAEGYLRDRYPLDLKEGRNTSAVVLGRRGEAFYWAGGRKIYFEQVPEAFLISAEGPNAEALTESALAKRSMTAESAAVRQSRRGEGSAFLRVESAPAARAIREITRELESSGLQVNSALIVKRGEETVQGLTDRLLVKFPEAVTEVEAARIARQNRLRILRRVLTAGNAFLMETTGGLSYGILDVAQTLIQNHGALAAEPEILSEVELDAYTPNDPLFNLLPHLPLINCDDAWEILGDWDPSLRGGSSQICIAVFDPDGVAPNHPDLTANLTDGASKMQTSFNFRNMAAQTVANLGGNHGTQCAGSATAAFDNNVGIAGVAPNCRLIGARIPSPATGVQMADAFLWAAGIDNGSTTPGFPPLPAQPADVISNSWGQTGAALSTALQAAFDRLTDEGRETRGCVVTFSPGNLGYVQFSNVRTFAAYVRTLAVGASINSNPTSPVDSSQADPNGNTTNIAVAVDTRTLFNPWGPEMDIVAPSHTCYALVGGALVDPITSAVRVGTGAVDGCVAPATCNDYATSFGGTSHSSPTIAGTCALVLSANSLLAWDEVREILARTAVKIDFGNTDPIGQYVDTDGDGVADFSQWYGFGRVDVAAAVEEALLLYVAEINLLASISNP
jgi:hypothetical protein